MYHHWCITIGDHYYPSDSDSEDMEANDSSSDDETDPFNIVHINGQDNSSYMTEDSMDFDHHPLLCLQSCPMRREWISCNPLVLFGSSLRTSRAQFVSSAWLSSMN